MDAVWEERFHGFAIAIRSYVTLRMFKNFSLFVSISSFVIRINLLHSQPSLFFYALILSLWYVSILVNYNFPVSFNLEVI